MQPLICALSGQIITDGLLQQECQEAKVMVGTTLPYDPGSPPVVRLYKFQQLSKHRSKRAILPGRRP